MFPRRLRGVYMQSSAHSRDLRQSCRDVVVVSPSSGGLGSAASAHRSALPGFPSTGSSAPLGWSSVFSSVFVFAPPAPTRRRHTPGSHPLGPAALSHLPGSLRAHRCHLGTPTSSTHVRLPVLTPGPHFDDLHMFLPPVTAGPQGRGSPAYGWTWTTSSHSSNAAFPTS